MTINRPHLGFPLGGPDVEQDTIEHIESRCLLVLSTPIGSLIDQPDFGVPGQAFTKVGVGLDVLRSALARWVPGTDSTITDEMLERWTRRIGITVRVNAQGA